MPAGLGQLNLFGLEKNVKILNWTGITVQGGGGIPERIIIINWEGDLTHI